MPLAQHVSRGRHARAAERARRRGPSLEPRFLNGRPSSFTERQGNSRLKRPNEIYALFVQDDWRPSPELMLSLGLRYDRETATAEALRQVTGEPGQAECWRSTTRSGPRPAAGRARRVGEEGGCHATSRPTASPSHDPAAPAPARVGPPDGGVQ